MIWLSTFSWLAGSKQGRIAGVILLSLAMLVIVVALAFRRGTISERAAQSMATLDHIRKRIASDEEISGLSPAERRERLLHWAGE